MPLTDSAFIQFTDPARWRLRTNTIDVHFWHYLSEEETKEEPQSFSEKYFLGLPRLSGPSFLLTGIIFALYITDYVIPPEWATEMTRWVCRYQNDDGGWGLHTVGPSNINATVMYYVALRILGSATVAPQWARYWLATINLYKWEGVQPVPFEIKWIHARVVYLPVSYIYANKCQTPLNDLLLQLREEIYDQPYDTIDFSSFLHRVAPQHRKRPINKLLSVANHAARMWEWYVRPSWIHNQANAKVRELIRREDENTEYNDLATVNKAWHLVAVYFSDDTDSEAVQRHHEKILPYLWVNECGMNAGGTNGAQVWDTEFSVLGIEEAGLGHDPQFREVLSKAHKFLDVSQFQDDADHPHRQRRKGGWPYSTKDNGYIVSDCAAEGLKSILILQEELGFEKIVSTDRLCDCVDTLLSMQNPDNGFGSYERNQATEYLEYLNPSEVFERCMVEYSYPECTSAVIMALKKFRKHYPDYSPDKIDAAVRAALQYLHSCQEPDGSWYGSWGICFTYGTMFALEGLAAGGHTFATSEAVRRGCQFLLEKQKVDGGWGERWESCEQREYVEHERSQVVQTAWAVLGLMAARYPKKTVEARGLELIRRRQLPNGEWLQEDIEGIFNATCTIEYPNYKMHFSIRALGRFHHEYVPALTQDLEAK
ncbi:terpene synthase [Lentithecium fluviatile CBS 122367]|uniref:Terpene cyclase/mutase family member n=1 Tax=Lentithecium fluviatile CBS 122367 TaxID=1168545 RepID=A0A6G1JPC6_9PLEO|nr:terpene synthase [Lentithecium fluviatile CBS 122367]